MEIRDWFNKAEALEVKHKGASVLSHPNVVSQQEAEWEEQRQEEKRGQKAHQAINELFSSLDEEYEELEE